MHRLGAIAVGVGLALAACGDDGGRGFAAGDDVQITWSPEALAFPAVPLGQRLERAISVRHVGETGVLRLRRPRLDTLSGDLTLEGPSSAALEAGESAEWTVVYDPADPAPDEARFTVEHNLAGRGPVVVDVTTPGQVGILLVEPGQVDFGVLAPGASARRDVTLRNIGSEAVTVKAVSFDTGGSGDFVAELDVDTLGVLPVGATRVLGVRYTPTGRDADEATLRVEATGAKPVLAVPVAGREMGPVLGAVPSTVGFGPVAVGDSSVQSLMLRNEGSLDLEITAIGLAEDALPGLSLGDAAEGPFPLVLGPNGTVWVDVVWAPEAAAAEPDQLLGHVRVDSNDLSAQPFLVPVSGQGGAPVLLLAPEDGIDFGYVAQGVTGTRAVTLTNLGQLPLVVDAVEVIDQPTHEMRVVPDAAFPATAADPEPSPLAPGASREVKLAFTNNGGTAGTVFGTLAVRSNDPERPLLLVDLVGRRAGEPTCQATFVPLVANFGGVPHQTSKTVDVKLVNQGAGNCVVQEVWVNRCWEDGVVPVCEGAQPSPQFHAVGGPAPSTVLGPGDAVAIPVRFDAPTFSGLDQASDRYMARLNARVKDPHTGDERLVPEPWAGWEPGPNLFGESGIPRINVYPDVVDFGWVPLGCTSATELVTVYSSGPIPLEVSTLAWSACYGDFSLADEPPLPQSLAAGDSFGLGPRFRAESLGERSCTLNVHSSDPARPVSPVTLRAEGVSETTVTETFDGKGINAVDVLFVVDDSGSMGSEQDNLSKNFQAFIQAANDWGTDYRIGVTTTDLSSVNGALKGVPPVVTPETWQSFLGNVKVGTNGSGTEQGLAAAEASLTGPFGAYLRPDASLVVIFVSDEEDQSVGDEYGYLQGFTSLKDGDPELFTAYAIVGPPGGCSSGQGDADGGLRYINVAEASGGAFASICDASFAEALAQFGEGTFGPKTHFPLSGRAVPGSVEVAIEGVACAGGWQLSADGRKVKFDLEGPCVPDDGDQVDITYDLACY